MVVVVGGYLLKHIKFAVTFFWEYEKKSSLTIQNHFGSLHFLEIFGRSNIESPLKPYIERFHVIFCIYVIYHRPFLMENYQFSLFWIEEWKQFGCFAPSLYYFWIIMGIFKNNNTLYWVQSCLEWSWKYMRGKLKKTVFLSLLAMLPKGERQERNKIYSRDKAPILLHFTQFFIFIFF